MKNGGKFKKYSYMKSLTTSLLFKNKIVLVGLVVTIMFIALSSNFHFKFQKILTKVEKHIAKRVSGGDETKELFIWFLTLPISHYLTSLIHKFISTYVLQSLLGELFRFCLGEYISLSYNDFHHLGSGEIHSLIERRADAIMGLVEILFTDVLFSIFFMFWGFKYFFHCSKGVVFLIIIQIFLYFWISWYGVRIRSRFRRKYNRSYDIASNRLYGILQQHDIIKAYNKEEEELSKYCRSLDAVGRDSRNYVQTANFIEFFQKSLFFLPNAFLVFNVMNGYLFNSMRVGDTYRDYAKFFSELRCRMMNLKDNIFKMNESLTDIFDSKTGGTTPDNKDAGVPMESFDGIRFENISIHIGDMLVIRNFSGEVKKGEKIGIIGKNGCGKSSFANVLLRFLDYSGNIIIDGKDLRSYKKSSVRNLISFVPQNHHLFDGTILENIAYSQEHIDHEDVMTKCKYFNAHETFSRLENGYQTNVGENGQFLSGGQKQRVSFMRAMIKDTDVVLLDEPTSNLDANAEKELIQMIFEKMEDKTVFLVVHNHNLLKGFDKIFGFSDNMVTVYETFDEFISNRSKY